MSNKKQKLELTWIGKEQQPKLEPRILLEDDTKSFHANHRVTESDLFDNKLIFGDNLLALKALEQEYAGKVKCVYIDPPFNTGAAFEHYDDGIEHSIWLGLMRDRFESLRNLLRDDGFIFVHLDDNEAAYCKVVLDEVFGRTNYFNQIIVSTNKPFGFKSTSDGIFKQANHIFMYAKDKSKAKIKAKTLFLEKEYDPQYKWVFFNTEKPENEWTWRNINDVVAENLGFSSAREARKHHGESFDVDVSLFAIENAKRVFRTASVSGGALLKRKETIQKSKIEKNKIIRHPNDDMDYMFIGGERVLPYIERLEEIDGHLLPGELVTDMWTDISIEGLANEGGVDFPKGKKPEKLIQRIIDMTTEIGDLILDSFGGSGTTGAVAHKMRRRWILVELGDHCHTHIIPRLQSVVSGADQSGISKSINWKGGGGFRYYSLAPSLIEFDKYDQPVINKGYNPVMLTQAMCKLMGFTYAPSDTVYWQQGYSTETDFIYVTTQTLEQAQLAALSEEAGEGRTLLICCSAFRGKADQFENLTVRKIPRAVLDKCDWSKDDYSLNVQNLPMLEQDNEPRTALKPAGSPRPAKAKKAASAAATGSLFGGDDADE